MYIPPLTLSLGINQPQDLNLGSEMRACDQGCVWELPLLYFLFICL